MNYMDAYIGAMDKEELYYPKKQKPYKERFEQTSFSDQVCGTLNPIVYALNKGKDIKSNSHEHKSLLELLQKANIS